MALQFETKNFDSDVRRAYEQLLPEQSDLIASGKLDWKFNQSPGGQGVAAIAFDDANPRELLGLVGFAPSRISLRGGKYRAFQAMDTIVHPKARGKGLFSKLGDAFYAECEKFDANILYGFPNENAAPGWFNKLQWSRLGTPPFLIKPLRARYFAARLHHSLNRMPDFPLMVPLPPSGQGKIVRLDSFDERVDALWSEFSIGINCAVHRDRDFLNWRLFSHPTETYDTTAIYGTEERLNAFVSTVTSKKHGGTIGYIMEAMALKGCERDLQYLLGKSNFDMCTAGVDAILAWSAPHAPNYRAYRRAGFYPIPEKIRPITLYFGGRALGPTSVDVMNSQTSWYLSYLDSDTV